MGDHDVCPSCGGQSLEPALPGCPTPDWSHPPAPELAVYEADPHTVYGLLGEARTASVAALRALEADQVLATRRAVMATAELIDRALSQFEKSDGPTEDRTAMSRVEELAWSTQTICTCESMQGRLGAHREECPVMVLRAALAGDEKSDD